MLARVVFLTLTISPFLSFEWLEAFSVSRFDPVGTVKQVRQVRAEFSSPMVPFGNPERLGDPFEVSCPANGRGRWLDPLTWVYEFDEVLPAGVECRFQLRQGITALDGTGFTGERPFAFNTGGPTVVYSVPSELSEIAEDAVFVLFLDGPADLSSVAAQVFLTMEGLAGTIPVVVEESGLREEILQSIYTRSHPEDHIVVVRPRQFLAPGRKVRLVWGAGVKAPSGLATQQDQVLDFTIRKEFTANFHCERENPGRGCIPLISMRLEFSAPVPEEHLRDARLLGPGDFERRPDKTDEPFLSTLEFSPPFPPETEFRLELPRGVRDDSGRPLVNADRFPLAVRTDRYPALVKFPAWFGVLESGEAAVLPVTVRWVETPMILHGKTVLQGVGLNGSVYRLPNNAPSLVLGWLQRLAGRRWEHRGTPVLADGLLPADRFELTRSPDSRAFEVVGIPLRKPGFYVVEIESRLLGEALLDPPGPAFVPAAALVTDLGVHFKWGVEQSLIWVTELGSGKPAAAVEVEVTDCSGKELWKGKTDSSGVAVPTTLPTLGEAPVCKYGRYGDGLLILARRGEDFSFSHSSWDDGIEPWRFQLPGVWDESLVAVHTVLDRTLLRAGETLHMKHILRRRSVEGFVSVPDEDRPEELIIRHVGSMERYILPLSWDEGGVAQTDWQVPEAAKLGSYRLIYRRQGDNGFREWAGVGFRVEEFRVPLMRGTLQVPPEPLAAPTEIPLTATVEYLSGGPAKALPVSLRYLFTPIEAGEFPNWDGYSFSGEDIREGLIRAGEQEEVEQSIPRTISATLDGSGGVTLPVPGPAPRHHPWLLQAELEFHDPNGVIQTVGWTKRIYPSSRLVGIKAAYQMSPDTNLQFDVAVIDLEGRGLPGVPVEVDVFKRNSFSHRKRLVGGFYAYDYGRETNRLGVVCEGTTDESGILHCEVTAPATGNLVLRALVSDEAGRVHRATKTIWVSGSPWRFEVEDSDRMTLVPENARYAPGEVARIQVQMPFQEATALVTVEREGVARWYVTSLRATEAYVEVPLLEQDVPNVFVSVLAVRGRVSGIPPTFFADLARPSYKLGIVELQVAEAGSRLKVKVEPEQTVYRVRETVRTRVQVTGADGRAAAGGEVAVAVVDEGLLELGPNGTWDVFSAMMGRRGYKVRTATAHMHVVGKRHFGQKAKPDGGGGGRVATRELFDTLVFWNARVPLDRSGEASFEFPLNDSMTSFRIVAVALWGLNGFGDGSAVVQATQELTLFSGVPPAVREGDRIRAEFTVRNSSGRPLAVSVRAKVEELGLEEVERLDLAPGEASVVAFPVEIPAGVTELTYLLEASADGFADRLRVQQAVSPVFPERVIQGLFRRLDEPWALELEPPPSAVRPGAIRLNLRPSLLGSLDGARDYMRGYQYGCLEQRLSRAVTLDDRDSWDRSMEALHLYLGPRGLLRYFAGTPESDVLTSYVLALAHEVGWPIPDEARRAMFSGLGAFVEGRSEVRSAQPRADLTLRKIAALEALSRYELARRSMVTGLFLSPEIWPTSTLIEWRNITRRLGFQPQFEEADRLLDARLVFESTKAGFSTENRDRLPWLMVSGDGDVARLILSWLESGLRVTDSARLVQGLVERQHGGRWDLTTANAWAALALKKFGFRFDPEPVTGRTFLRIEGAQAELVWEGESEGGQRELPWPLRRTQLLADHNGAGAPWLWVRAVAAVRPQPMEAGFRLRRTVTPVEQRRPGRCSVGDVVRVRIEVEAALSHDWVVVDDPIPSGAGILGVLARDSRLARRGEKSEWMNPPDFEERARLAYRGWWLSMPSGRSVTEYTLRFGSAGRFILPPTRVEAIYAPEVYAELPNDVIEVDP